MKRIYFSVLLTVFTVFFSVSAFAAPREGYTKVAGITKGRLNMISYCDKWNEAKLLELYDELLLNFHGDEFIYLQAIYIYPDSPGGESGNYYEDVRKNDKGSYALGGNAYIELYNGSTKSTVAAMAPVISHEYGHHYTIFNIMRYEQKFYTSWADSEYGKLRSLKDYPIIYDPVLANEYHREWDIVEIAACDYVQLLGSPNARKSYNYLDSKELAEKGDDGMKYRSLYFNAKPQENFGLPLAADVDGLYAYMLKTTGYTASAPQLVKKPQIKAVNVSEAFVNKTYTLTFEPAEGTGPFEYTIVMYPTDRPLLPVVIKTISDGEPCTATFGTVLSEDGEKYVGILDYYTGEFEIRIFTKDARGFVYSSQPAFYDFGEDYFDVNKFLTDERTVA